MSDSETQSGVPPGYPVEVDPSSYLGASDAELADVERGAVEQILNRAPAEYRSEILQMLTRGPTPQMPGLTGGQLAVVGFAGSADPVIAHWLGVIQSVRAAGARHAEANLPGARAAPSGERVFVTVAYDAGRDADSVALLRPCDAFPTLVLRRDADAVEMRAGLAAAATLFRDFGAHPAHEHRAAVPPNEPGTTAPSTAHNLLARIQATEPRNLPALGRLPAIEVVHYTRR